MWSRGLLFFFVFLLRSLKLFLLLLLLLLHKCIPLVSNSLRQLRQSPPPPPPFPSPLSLSVPLSHSLKGGELGGGRGAAPPSNAADLTPMCGDDASLLSPRTVAARLSRPSPRSSSNLRPPSPPSGMFLSLHSATLVNKAEALWAVVSPSLLSLRSLLSHPVSSCPVPPSPRFALDL